MMTEKIQPSENALWCSALAAPRGCLFVSVFSAVTGILLENTVSAAILSVFSMVCLAGISLAIAWYAAIFIITLSSQVRLLGGVVVFVGAGALLIALSAIGFGHFHSVAAVLGLFLLFLGVALAGSLILSSSVLIHDSKQTRSKL